MSKFSAGVKTSEFYLTVFTLIAVAVLSALDFDTTDFVDIARFLVPGYAVARGVAKNAPPVWDEVTVEEPDVDLGHI